LRALSLPPEGITIDIPVDSAWASGFDALVSAYRPSDVPGPQQRGPGRAIGVAWLGINSSSSTLLAALTEPSVARPRGPIAVKVAGLAAGKEAYVTLAAVDEAVLKLTEFASPALEKYYFGKPQLGVELRDLYGWLIDGRANGVGVLRSGGDSFAKTLGCRTRAARSSPWASSGSTWTERRESIRRHGTRRGVSRGARPQRRRQGLHHRPSRTRGDRRRVHLPVLVGEDMYDPETTGRTANVN
jgi:uncharacterized protein YfaS (alpha-2-macroglobulin family)